MFDRLSTQVFLVSIGVAIVAALLTGVLVRDRTVQAFEDAVERDLATDSAIFASASAVPYLYDSWDDARPELDQLSAIHNERIAITGLDGQTVLYDSDPGEDLPEDSVTILRTDPTLDPVDEEAINACLEENSDVFFALSPDGEVDDFGEPVFEDSILGGSVFANPEAIEAAEQAFAECVVLRQSESAASALLFLGYPSEQVDLGSLSAGGLLLGAGGVLLFAGFGAVVLSRRVSEPVAALTAAASGMQAGDMSQRVRVRGTGEIAELGHSFNEMAGRLEKNEQSRQRLISDVAHELRNPIGVLQGSLEAAQDGVLPLNDEMVASLVSETQHLGQLVRDLQEVNSAEYRGLRLNPQPLDLGELCGDVVATYGPINPGIAIRVVQDGPVPVTADAIRMRQVVENLVKNAVLHTDPGGSVDVKVSSTSGNVIVGVADTGHGIAADDLPFVFDRFWRADRSRARETGGSGLGLAISRAIVEAHGGTITASSTLGVGSTFAVSLPAAPR